ncbi:MAG: VIT domain-containing protein [Phycisphaerae bacterium]
MPSPRTTALSLLLLCLIGSAAMARDAVPGQGQLILLDEKGEPAGFCPLKHTRVDAVVSGMTAFVQVNQTFTNDSDEKIEAVYTFPLPADAAVSEMTMKVGDRTVVGKIKPRAEARQIYEQAKSQGHVASLLDQQRPNIFTQAVANIEPNATVEITIGYTETLDYEAGNYEFSFPMVVGPRYQPLPDQPTGSQPEREGIIAPRPPRPQDDDQLNPPVTPKGTRAGHDISVNLYLSPGIKIQQIDSKLHAIDIEWLNPEHTRTKISLAEKKEIPNKDFVLQFSTASEKIEDALLTHTDEDRGGFFTLLLQPPAKPTQAQIVPRELMFVIDTSGSQQGFPLDLSQTICKRAIENLRPGDTFNIMRFANAAEMLFDEYVENTEANRTKALKFIEDLKASGGTRMATAMNACLEGQAPEGKVRIVAYFTDGYVSNDMEMIDIVKTSAGATRVFSFGTGKSVNRYCLDGIAQAGRGEVEYVLSEQGAEKKADRFYERIDKPVLVDISVDFGELAQYIQADEIYPKTIPDLFSVKPVLLKGRFTRPDQDVTGTITLTGRSADGKFTRKLQVTLPAKDGSNPVLAQQWARSKVEYLMGTDLRGIQQGNPDEKVKDQIIALGSEFGIMTRYTSFVAVEEQTVTIAGQPRRVDVPVELPEGVSYEGIFGDAGGQGGGPGGPGVMPRRERAARSGAAGVAPAARPNTPAAQTKQMAEAAKPDSDRVDGADDKAAKPTDEQRKQQLVQTKLAKVLHGLADKLDEKGNHSSGSLVVKDGKVTLAVYLSKLDEQTRKALTDAGMKIELESAPADMVIGTIDVAKLHELALLDAVGTIDLPSLSG